MRYVRDILYNDYDSNNIYQSFPYSFQVKLFPWNVS